MPSVARTLLPKLFNKGVVWGGFGLSSSIESRIRSEFIEDSSSLSNRECRMLNVFLNFLPFILVAYVGSLFFSWLTYGRTMKLERYFARRGSRIKWYMIQEVKVLAFFLLFGGATILSLDIIKPSYFWVGLIGIGLAFGFGYLRAYFYDGDLAIHAFTNALNTVFCSPKQKRFRLQWRKRRN